MTPGALPRRRWPLLAIGASAGTATWSGWVGLGQLTGFGVVHPLPGIADGFTINTAVTLPIGVEAYATYALSIATSNRALQPKVRRYAWASSAAALLLGMAGQVAYHVMTAAHPLTEGQASHLAPWQVIALVSCLPVLVLGAASLLWHLAGAADTRDPASTADPADREESGPAADPAADGDTDTQNGPAAALRPARPDDLARLRDAITAGPRNPLPVSPAVPAHDSGDSVSDPVSATVPPGGNGVLPFHVVHAPAPGRRDPEDGSARGPRSRARSARPADVRRLRQALAEGVWPALPSVRDVRDHLAISSGHAAAARRIMAAELATAHPPDETQKPHSTAPEHQPEQDPKHPPEEPNSAATKKASQ